MATAEFGRSLGRRERIEKFSTVINPCPPVKTDEIYKRANVRRVGRVKDGYDFEIEVQIGTDPEDPDRERLALRPGDELELPVPKAQDVLREKGHRGIVVIDHNDPYMSMIRGLETAVAFFALNGEEARHKLQQHQGHNAEQIEAFRHGMYAPFFLNEARTAILIEEIDNLHKLRDQWLEKKSEDSAASREEQRKADLIANEAEIFQKAQELLKLKEAMGQLPTKD